MQVTGYATLLLMVFVAVPIVPSHAACASPGMVSSIFPKGADSYIYTPGVEPSASSSSITADNFTARFWAFGAGDPAFAQGLDSGDFMALGRGRDRWVHRPLGYPAFFHTTWAASGKIDGCINETESSSTCTAVLLTDQHDGKGYFALLTAAPTSGDYSFAQPNNAPITLAPIPKPNTSNLSTFPSSVQGTVRVDLPQQGQYLHASCPTTVVLGYKVYTRVLDRGAAPPKDIKRSTGQWQLVDGGETVAGQPLALGADAAITVQCGSSKDVYIAASLVFDSGFETEHVSERSSRIRCD